jgi:hypothetical protein
MSSPAPVGRRSWPKVLLHVIRRIHLLVGLLLAPWMVMFAVSAFLLNHPTVFPDQEGTVFAASEVSGTSLADLRGAGDIATDVVAELNRRAGREDYRLVRPEKAQYRGDFASAVLRTDGKAYTVLVDVRDGTGFARLRAEPKEKAPFTSKLDTLPGELVADQLKAGLPKALERAGLSSGEITVTFVPDVHFDVEAADGRAWRATYSPMSHSLTGTTEVSDPLTTRRFLTRLHVSRGYSPSSSVRWFWALSVDIVSIAMIFWVASGLVMWLQLKSVRVTGLAVIVVCAVAATWLAIGMHAQFSP